MAWPFRRRRRRNPHALEAEPPALDRARREWATLPPLATTVASRAPLTAPAAQFARGLTSRRSLVERTPVRRTSDRPIGMVAGVATLTPVTGRAGVGPLSRPIDAKASQRSSALPPPPLRRRVPIVTDVEDLDDLLNASAYEPEAVPEAVVDLRPPDLHVTEDDVEVVVVAPPPASEPEVASPVPVMDDEPAPLTMRRPSLAQSRRLGLGPAYHGALPDALEHLRRPPAPSPPTTEPVPESVRNLVRDAFSTDVADQPVQRGPEVSEEARRLGARAYARGGQVFVPVEEGPLDRPEVRGIVAHELTHAAQQRRAHGSPPAEDSPAGRRLEAAAQATERHARGDAGAPAPTPDFVSVEQMMQDLVDTGVAVPDGRGGVVFAPPPPPPPPGSSAGTQRLTNAAEPASDRDTWGRSSNASAFSTFMHDLGEDVMATVEEVAGSAFGLGDSMMQSFDDARENRETQFQEEAEYRARRTTTLRTRQLEHLRRTSPGAPEPAELSASDLQRIDDEVEARIHALEERVQTRLINAHVNHQPGTPEMDVLPPEQFRVLAENAFSGEGLRIPDDNDEDEAVGAEARQRRAEGSAATARGGSAGGAGATGQAGARGGAAASAGLAGASARGRANDSPARSEFSEWDDVSDALTLDAVGFATDPWGISLSSAEQRELVDGPTRAATPDRTPAERETGQGADDDDLNGAVTHLGPDVGGQRGVSASGHEHIDLDHLDMKALTEQLYPRVLAELRNELRTGRERAGTSADRR